jgi:hypothetical protein
MPHRLLLGLLTLVTLILAASPARAWVELHTVAYEARVEVSRQGSAKVDHILRLKVGGGPLRSFDVKIGDRNVVLSEEAWLAKAEEGLTARVPIPVTLEQRPDGDLRVDIDGKRGVGRGMYELRFSYTIDLLQQEAVEPDGSMMRINWTGPRLDDGIDNMKVTVVVPAAPTEPRAAPMRVGAEGEGATFQEAGAFLVSVTRNPQADEISLTRPHVAKREAVTWAVRVDARAIGELSDPRMRQQTEAQPQPAQEESSRDRAIKLGAMAAGALLFALLMALKHRDVVKAARERSVDPRPLVPLGIAVRVGFGAPMLAGGVAWQMLAGHPLPGSLAVLGAMLLTAYVPPRRISVARGPGRWLPFNMTDPQIASRRSTSWLDASTWPGRITLLLAVAGVAVGVWQVARVSLYHAHLVAMDAVVLFALLGTGLRRSLPGDPVHASAEVLASIARHLRGAADVKVGVLGRIPIGADRPDEVRLQIRLKNACRGLMAVEVGVAWFQGMGGPVAMPEVLVRAADASECHERITSRMRAPKWVRGRESHQRVLTLAPAMPTTECTARLVRHLCEWITSPVPAAQPAPARPVRRGQPRSSNARMSSGNSASTLKPASDPLPFHDKW